MKAFHCDHCKSVLFFENVLCLGCRRTVAYLPDIGTIASLDPAAPDSWRTVDPRAEGQTYRLCRNYREHKVCNWAVPARDPNPFCASCRLTSVIPDLSKPGNRQAWFKLASANRRLIYSLLMLGLPVVGKQDDPEKGLTFEYLADAPAGCAATVMTGHRSGLITISLAEADDAERERRRLQMGERYRTVLGHFRHEIGHYYWDRLINGSPHLAEFRTVFGDERQNYQASLARHYGKGAPRNWQESHISEYATAHPWEDWAETWAHFLHMTDALETAGSCGFSLKPRRAHDFYLDNHSFPWLRNFSNFDAMTEAWFSLTHVLNNLNRGLGLNDAYPFILSTPALAKLRFVHQVVTGIQAKGKPRRSGIPTNPFSALWAKLHKRASFRSPLRQRA